uniref:Uncharacterized protein n=1 Tax=viral metagenome TaxID=1070528 RepID=A0A6M3LKN0_9ZZZZ
MLRREFLKLTSSLIAGASAAIAAVVQPMRPKGISQEDAADLMATTLKDLPKSKWCLIYDTEQRPFTRLVRYVGKRQIQKGTLVYYVDDKREKVTCDIQTMSIGECYLNFAGVVKITPEIFAKEQPYGIPYWLAKGHTHA